MTETALRPCGEVTLLVEIEDERWGTADALTDQLNEIAAAISNVLAEKKPELCVRARQTATVMFSVDAQVQRLNREFRRQDKPTNVLSFPAPEGHRDDDGAVYLGDVILGYETVATEAAGQTLTIEAHFTHLVVHGILHLFGFDHMRDEEAAMMERLETEILATLGIADPYVEGAAE